MPFCHVTTGIAGDPDQELCDEKCGERSFPRLLFLDANGRVVARQAERTVASFEKSLQALLVLERLDRPDATRDRTAAARVFTARLQLGRLGLEEAAAQRPSLELDRDQQRIYDQEIVNLTVAAHYATAQRDRDYSALGAKFVTMKRSNRIPDGSYARNFWSRIMQHAQTERDAVLYTEAYREYRKLLGEDERYRRVFARYDEVLAALRDGRDIPAIVRAPEPRTHR